MPRSACMRTARSACPVFAAVSATKDGTTETISVVRLPIPPATCHFVSGCFPRKYPFAALCSGRARRRSIPNGKGFCGRAWQMHLSHDSVSIRIKAARVADSLSTDVESDLPKRWRALSEIHAAPKWLWPALVSRLVAKGWTVEIARREAQKVKDVAEPPEWADTATIAAAIVTGEMKPGDVDRDGSRRIRGIEMAP